MDVAESHMAKTICNLLEHEELRPLPVLEGPSAIPKNRALMDPAQQALMIPPFHPISIVIVVLIKFFWISLVHLMYPGLGPLFKKPRCWVNAIRQRRASSVSFASKNGGHPRRRYDDTSE